MPIALQRFGTRNTATARLPGFPAFLPRPATFGAFLSIALGFQPTPLGGTRRFIERNFHLCRIVPNGYRVGVVVGWTCEYSMLLMFATTLAFGMRRRHWIPGRISS